MKSILLLCGVLVLLTSATAFAAGVNLSWDKCGAAGSENKHFACDTNTGTAVLVASVRAPAGISLWTVFETFIDVQASGASFPAWWQLRNQGSQTGQCRAIALSVSGIFIYEGAPYLGACAEVYGEHGSGGIRTYLIGSGGANHARFEVVFAVPVANAVPLNEGVEYVTMRAMITYAKTVGMGSCVGCSEEVLLVCTKVFCKQSTDPPSGGVAVTDPAERNFIVWNQSATQARSATWGAIKALYR